MGPGHHGVDKRSLLEHPSSHSSFYSFYIFYWLLFCSGQDPFSSHGPSWIPLASLPLPLFSHLYNHTLLLPVPVSMCNGHTLLYLPRSGSLPLC